MATYKDYVSIQKARCLNRGDILLFEKIDCTLSIRSSYLSDIDNGSNAYIFKQLNITDRQAFCSVAYGYAAEGGQCPECRDEDYSALTQLALALMCEYEKKFEVSKVEVPKSIFKVGDKVTILPQYLPGTDCNSYRLIFYSYMLKLGGKTYTISNIIHGSKGCLSDDPHYYCLDGMGFCFSPDMFEETYIKSSYSAAKKAELIQDLKGQRAQRCMEEEMAKIVASANTKVTTKTCSILDKVLYQSVDVKSDTKSSQKYSVLLESEIEIKITKKSYLV